MSWIALLWVGIGVTDLVFSLRPARFLPEAVGASAVVALSQVAGLRGWRDLVAVAAVVLAVLGWGVLVTRGFGRGSPAEPLAWLAGWLFLVLLVSPAAGSVSGPFADWVRAGGGRWLGTEDPDRMLLTLGAVLVQLSTGNVLVRLVLRATGTLNPGKVPRDGTEPRLLEGPAHSLKGGRLLGPMERLLILGLGLAGQLTAASVVVAAKGLLRFPELQAARDASDRGPGIHVVTEYFLVGSFVSWLVALGTVSLIVG